jgi:NTE family protein
MNRIWPLEGTRWRSYFLSLRIGLALFTVIVSPLIAVARSAPQAAKRLTIGVALEGGGALGLAHIGVLRWFEQHQIPVDYIAGTSMGGLVRTPTAVSPTVGPGK